MRHLCGAGVGVSLALLLSIGSAEAGWVIGSRFSDGAGTSGAETTYIQRDRIREESPDSVHVMDFQARRILWIQPREKKYSAMTFDEFRKTMREAMEAAQAAREQLKGLGIQPSGAVPGAPPKGKVTVRKIAGATVAGYACDGYAVSVGGTPTEEIWMTKKIDLSSEIGPATMKEFEDLSKEFRRMGMGADESLADPEYRELMESGYPMKVVDKRGGFTREVTKAERRPVDASLFEEPKGFEKVPHKNMFGAMPDAPPEGMGMSPEQREKMRRGVEQSQPVEEKKGDTLDTIRDKAGEGIKKLFKW